MPIFGHERSLRDDIVKASPGSRRAGERSEVRQLHQLVNKVIVIAAIQDGTLTQHFFFFPEDILKLSQVCHEKRPHISAPRTWTMDTLEMSLEISKFVQNEPEPFSGKP